jgi:rhamnosyltransferase subunit B
MHALLIGFGSAGDVLPVAAIGRALKRRGHRVTLVANGHFAPLAPRAGLEFAELGTEEEYDRITSNPHGAHPIYGLQALMRLVGEKTRSLYDLIAARFVPGETVAVATSLAFGARVAQERLGLPLATLHLSPTAFRSVHNTGAPGRRAFPPLPAPLRRMAEWASDALIIDPPVSASLNAACADLGLAPVRRPCWRWWNSPDLVLGLFPSWYAAPQPDWPVQARLVGFVRDSQNDEPELSPEVSAFLDAGEAPVVFTGGSANRHAVRRFLTAREVCARLKIRSILVSPFRDQVPADLPPSILHISYVSFARLLPRVAALVHHGGIGTAAQAMASARPQLVVPMAYDQLDNAARLVGLGVARSLSPRRFRPKAAARALEELLGSPAVAEQCRAVAARFAVERPVDEACDAIEALLAARAKRLSAIPE